MQRERGRTGISKNAKTTSSKGLDDDITEDEWDLIVIEATDAERFYFVPSCYWRSKRGKAVAALLRAQGRKPRGVPERDPSTGKIDRGGLRPSDRAVSRQIAKATR